MNGNIRHLLASSFQEFLYCAVLHGVAHARHRQRACRDHRAARKCDPSNTCTYADTFHSPRVHTHLKHLALLFTLVNTARRLLLFTNMLAPFTCPLATFYVHVQADGLKRSISPLCTYVARDVCCQGYFSVSTGISENARAYFTHRYQSLFCILHRFVSSTSVSTYSASICLACTSYEKKHFELAEVHRNTHYP